MGEDLTAEVRWFFAGEPESGVGRAFDSISEGPEESRTDYYLRFVAAESVGVKWREGRLEAKAVVRDLGPHRFGDAAEGRVELWEKRSAGEDASAAMIEEDPESWMAVDKRRVVGFFEERQGVGCQIELARLRVEQRRFWTIGFEAYGTPDRLEELLRRTATQFLGRHPDLRLPLKRSRAYPAFLLRLQNGEE